eukprot:COSAG01_NODE_2297_length_7966_cov_145.938604_7_plen_80_part_00
MQRFLALFLAVFSWCVHVLGHGVPAADPRCTGGCSPQFDNFVAHGLQYATTFGCSVRVLHILSQHVRVEIMGSIIIRTG